MKKTVLIAALALGCGLSASAQFDPVVVAEEGTGAWCGWCPRGIVGFKEMSEKHPDQFIGIAIHNGDEMAFDAYLSFTGITGLPGCNINRMSNYKSKDPNAGTLEAAFKSIMANKVNGKIELSDVKLSDDHKSITLDSKVTFAKADDKSKYNVLYVVIEDNVNGTYQANYFAGGGSGVMGGFESMPSKISPFLFQHVARSVYPENQFRGEEIATKVTDGQEISNSLTIPMPANVQEPYFCKVAAILLQDGVIINGDEAHVAEITRELPEAKPELSAGAYTDSGIFYSIELSNPTDKIIYTTYHVTLEAKARAGETYTSGDAVVLLQPKENKTITGHETFDGIEEGSYVFTVEATNEAGDFVEVGSPIAVNVGVREAATLVCDWAKVNDGKEVMGGLEAVPVTGKFTCEQGQFYYRLTFRFHPKGEKKPLVAASSEYVLVETGKSLEVTIDANLRKLAEYQECELDVTTQDANKKTVTLASGIPFTINPGAVGIVSIDADNSDAPVEYFDLQGRRVVEPTNGLYIRRQGTEVKKVVID